MTEFDRVRILVLGDSGVGKTSLVHLIARGKPLSHITYTIGASNEVKLHEYKEGTPAQRTYWIGMFLFLAGMKNSKLPIINASIMKKDEKNLFFFRLKGLYFSFLL